MKKTMKFTGKILGALVLGGFMGWAFGLLGMDTPAITAIAVAIATLSSTVYKTKKTA